jgi:hypothetical protein
LLLPCTEQGIRNAVAAGGGPYRFDCDGPTTVTTVARISIYKNVSLDGEGNLTVDGNDAGNVFSVSGRATAELHGLTVIGGHTAIFNGGQTLSLTNTTVSGNHTGIENLLGTMTVTNSTVSGEWGIRNFEGTMTVTNSTVSGDYAIKNDLDATMTLTNCTVSGDIHALASATTTSVIEMTATLLEGACTREGNGVTIRASNGHNIESPGNTCGFDQEGDQVDVTEGQLNLGPLQDNGGPTETHALLTGSVAIDQIPEVDCVDADGEPLTTDQRGFPRGSMCDVGAFEVQP